MAHAVQELKKRKNSILSSRGKTTKSIMLIEIFFD
jgi:hypothetical protein